MATRQVDVRTAYRKWAPNYPPTAHNRFMELEQDGVLALLADIPPGGSCLDLACGTGRYWPILKEWGAESIIGVDLSPEMLSASRRFGVEADGLVQADMLSLPFRSATFCLVLCALAMGHVGQLGRALKEAARVLTPGGAIIYSDLHPFRALLGRERTFLANDGHEYSVQHTTHLISDHFAECRKAGLRIDGILEIGDPADMYDLPTVPRVLIVRAVAD
jgi:ubiquinone/menaquinone biosynthesis C-methylase UbiE